MSQIFDVFVSYDRLTGPKFTENIKEALKRRGLHTFVAHLEQDNYSGNFEDVIDGVISICKYFILVLTVDTLKRDQVIREVIRAFPKHHQRVKNLWVFRYGIESVPRNDREFEFQTGINLEKENQHDFRDEADLANKVLIQWDNRKIFERISIKKEYQLVEIESIYDLFGAYAQKIKYEYEHHTELDQKGERRLIDVMASADLYRYFVPQTLSYETREQFKKTRKYRIVQRKENAQQFLLKFVRQKSGVCILLGDYGSGKTSICLNLTYILAIEYIRSGKTPIPIFVSLRNYGTNDNIHEFLSGILRRQYNIDINTEVLVELLERGQFVLILDGFDEMSTSSKKGLSVTNLKQILTLYTKKSKIILTSRTHFFKSQSHIDDLLKLANPSGKKRSAMQIVQVNPLDQNQIREFLQKRTIQWQNQLMKIREIYNLEDLATRPLLLEMISETISKIATGIHEIDASYLYKVYTDLWIEHDDWRSIMKPAGKRKFMQELAEKMFINNKSHVHYSKLSKPLTENFKQIPSFSQIKDSYYYDATTCSFLSRDSNGNYRFIHKSFMEYFVADKFSSDIMDNNLTNFGKLILTKEIREFTIPILRNKIGTNSTYKSLDNKEILYNVLHRLILLTRKKEYSRTFLGSNAITFLKYMDIPIKDPNLSNCVIHFANIEGMSFVGFNFDDANLENCNMKGCRVQRSSFINSKLSNAQMHNATANNCDFSKTKAQKLKMIQADCSYCDFSDTDLSNSTLSGTNFYKSIFTKARLAKADLVSTNLESANMKDCVLQETDLESSNLRTAYLVGGNLIGASLVAANLRSANLSGTNISKIRASNIELDPYMLIREVKIDRLTYNELPKNLKKLIDRDSPQNI